MQSNKDYIGIILDVFTKIDSSSKGKRLLVESNVLKFLLNFALDIVMNQEGGEVYLVERQTALTFLVTVWKLKPDFVEG